MNFCTQDTSVFYSVDYQVITHCTETKKVICSIIWTCDVSQEVVTVLHSVALICNQTPSSAAATSLNSVDGSWDKASILLRPEAPLIFISGHRSQTQTTLHPESKDSSQEGRGKAREEAERGETTRMCWGRKKKSGRRPKCNFPPTTTTATLQPPDLLILGWVLWSASPHTLLTLLHCGTTP